MKKVLALFLATITIFSMVGCSKKIDHSEKINSILEENTTVQLNKAEEKLLETEYIQEYFRISEDENKEIVNNYIKELNVNVDLISSNEEVYTYAIQVDKPKLVEALMLLQTSLTANDYLYADAIIAREYPEVYMSVEQVSQEEVYALIDKYTSERALILKEAFTNEHVQKTELSGLIKVSYNKETETYDFVEYMINEEVCSEQKFFYTLFMEDVEELIYTFEKSTIINDINNLEF